MTRNGVLFFFLVLSSQLIAQINQRVFWIHGLNDNANCWNIYEQRFALSHRLVSNDITYDTNLGVVNAAREIRPIAGANLVVAHSMGGLVARQAYRDGLRFDRFVSFGTPHNGARIANAINNGNLKKFTVDGIYEVTRGIRATALALVGLSNYNVKWAMGNVVLSKTGLSLIYTAFERLLIEQFGGNAAQNIAEGAAEINQLNGYNMGIPSIAVFGTEQQPVFARFGLGSALKRNEYIQTYYRDMGDAPDEKGVKTQENILLGFDIATGVCSATAVLFGVKAFFNFGLSAPKAVFFGYAATQWDQSARFLRYHVDTKWSHVIGATRYETVSYYAQAYQCDVEWDKYLDKPKKRPSLGDCYYTYVLSTRQALIQERSDGLLHQSTQSDLPGATRALMSENTNHFELTNNFESEQRLNQILAGDHNRAFNIPLR